MATKTSKVVSVTLVMNGDKPFQTKHKNYYHKVVMENGDKGFFETPYDRQIKFVPSTEVEYEIFQAKKEDKPNETFSKIRPVKKEEGQQSAPPPAPTQAPPEPEAPPIPDEWKDKPTIAYDTTQIVIASQQRAVEAWLGNGIGREDIPAFAKEMAHFLVDLIDELNREKV